MRRRKKILTNASVSITTEEKLRSVYKQFFHSSREKKSIFKYFFSLQKVTDDQIVLSLLRTTSNDLLLFEITTVVSGEFLCEVDNMT